MVKQPSQCIVLYGRCGETGRGRTAKMPHEAAKMLSEILGVCLYQEEFTMGMVNSILTGLEEVGGEETKIADFFNACVDNNLVVCADW